MKYGIREICDVVLKARARMTVGDKIFYKNEPVIYFDSLKTSTMEGAATTVYAQGGRGNARLIAWEGERTVTFTMEDALISTLGLAILTGADVIDASEGNSIKVHTTERTDKVDGTGCVYLEEKPYTNGSEHLIYVMMTDANGDIKTEPYIYTCNVSSPESSGEFKDLWKIEPMSGIARTENVDGVVIVDYYVEKLSGVQQINITPDTFGGNFYLEASTLFRDTNGTDLPAEFIIPNCKIQSNFTFTMASSGDPSTFTFTLDAFPGETRFDPTKKVLSAIQVIGSVDDGKEYKRVQTDANGSNDYVLKESQTNPLADAAVTAAIAAIDAIPVDEEDATYETKLAIAEEALASLTPAQIRKVYNYEIYAATQI